MVRIGIDLGKFKSDTAVMDTAQHVSERFRGATTREGFQAGFANRPKAVIAIEAGRDSRWVHEVLTSLGHEVHVMDTTQARAMGVGRGKRKTNRRDAEALARALWTGSFPEAHVLSAVAARLRNTLLLRRQLVAQRTGLVTQLRGQFQAEGWVVPSCEAKDFTTRLRATRHELVGSTSVQAALEVLDTLNLQIRVLEQQLGRAAEAQSSYAKLRTTPGVKLIVGLTFIAALDDPKRFKKAHQVEAHLGLVPGEASTGEGRRLGHITKTGNAEARAMLIQAAWTLMRNPKHQEDALVVWARQVSARRGPRIAAVALARRLAGVLWAMWRHGTTYDPKRVARESAEGLTQRAKQANADARRMRAAA